MPNPPPTDGHSATELAKQIRSELRSAREHRGQPRLDAIKNAQSLIATLRGLPSTKPDREGRRNLAILEADLNVLSHSVNGNPEQHFRL